MLDGLPGIYSALQPVGQLAIAVPGMANGISVADGTDRLPGMTRFVTPKAVRLHVVCRQAGIREG